MTRSNETTKADKPGAKDIERRTRAQALDVPAETDPPQPDDERKRLRDAAAATAEGVDESKLIAVDANRVEFTMVDPSTGTLSATERRVRDPETTEDVPQDIIKVDPARVRFSSIDPSNGPTAEEPRPQVVDALGIPIPAESPPEAFKHGKSPQK